MCGVVADGRGFFCGWPFLKQGGGGVDVKGSAIPSILEGDGAVASKIMVVHIDAAASPTCRNALLGYGNVATIVGSTETIVNAQGAVREAC